MEIWENLLNELRYETPDPLARFSSFQPDHIFITHRWEIWLGVFFPLSSSVRCDHEFYRAFRGSFDFSFLTNSKILVGLGASALIRKCTKNYVCRRWISFAWMRSNIIHSHKNINSLQSHSSCLTYCLQSARQNQMGKRNRNGKRKRIKGTYK